MYYIFERQLKSLVLRVSIGENVAALHLFNATNSKITIAAFENFMFFLALKKNIALTAPLILIVALFVHTWRHRTADPSCHTPTRTFTGNSSRIVWRNTEHKRMRATPLPLCAYLLTCCLRTRITPRRENRNDGRRRSWLALLRKL